MSEADEFGPGGMYADGPNTEDATRPAEDDEENDRIIELVRRLRSLSDDLMVEVGPVMVARNSAVAMQDAADSLVVYALGEIDPQ